MGFQYRKRTKGKSGWFNFSYSDKNGLGMSTSVKVGGITHNFGGKRANRTTVDLGNGLKYVSYGPSKAKKRSTTKSQPVYTSSEPLNWGDVYWIFSFIFAALIIGTLIFETWPWKIVALIAAVGWFGYAYDQKYPTASDVPPTPQTDTEPTLDDMYQYYRECEEDEYNIFIASLREDYTDESVDDFIQKVNRRV